MKKLLLIITSSVFTLVLAACNSSDQTGEEIYTHLEEAVELESDFQDAQAELVDIEKEENVLYEEMIEINMEELDQVEEKANQAKELSEQRKELMDTEMESIEAGKEEFDKIGPLIEELEEGPAEKANELVSVMENRYEAFDQLHETYLSSIESDQALYDMLMDEELDKETLDQQVDEINEKYEQIAEHQQAFNEQTNQFNEMKKEFYDTIELNVEYAEES